MVLQKRLDYGSSGYQVPAMPQVPRFAKGKRSIRRRVEANPMCAFDLLATVAGKLLETRNSSAPLDSVKQEQLEKGKTIDCDKRAELLNSLGTIPEKCRIDRRSPDSMDYCKSKTEECIKTPLRAERRMARKEVDGNALAMCGLEDPMDVDSKLPALVSSDSSVGIPPSIPKLREHMEDDVDRDDDENSSGCTHPRAVPSKAFRPQRIGDRRVRKLLASKYWKVAPSMVKDGEFSDTEMKPVYRGRKMCYTRQRTQRCSFKRRKIFEHCTVSASDGGAISEGTSNSPVNGSIKLEAIDAELQGASGASSSSTGQNSSYESGDLHVKFSIKSFKVPELFIEIPENATVGSLKRTVMEAVTAILEGGLRVGVLLQGKKVRDDSKTLIQAGISHEINKMENLGFTLEPNPSRTPPSLTTPENFLPPCNTTEQLTRIPAVVPPSDQSNATLQPPLTPVANCLDSDHDSVHSPADVSSLDKTTSNSKALVPVPSMSVDALTVVPLRKSRRSELAQRRIRRPFSVAEVEALVQAVEKLGTGRWRDVKLRAFDNAKHRTYVDLKDKWKTLVHTARISPQQRRGEPVPQELLDRVLAAHAYWSQQQAKLQVKTPPVEACLLF